MTIRRASLAETFWFNLAGLRAGVLVALACALGAVLGGCGAITKPTAEFAGVTVQNFTMNDATLVFDVKVGNPYPVEMPLLNVGYALSSGENALLSGKAADLGAIPAGSAKVVQVPVKLNFAALIKAGSGVKLGSVVPYAASLDLSARAPAVGEFKLPQVKHAGELPIPAPPEVTLAGAPSWDKLSLSEIEGTVPVRVKNTNGFKIDLRRLDMTLTVAGTQLGQAGVSQAGSLEPGASLDIPIKASFRPSGLSFSMLSALRDRSQFKLAGTLDVGTPYAPLKMSFGQ